MKFHLPLALLFAVACGKSAQVDDILALDGDAEAGATLYADNCAGCHGADATGGSGPNLVEEAGEEEEEFIDTILSGEGDMPSFEGDLTDQEIADIMAFLQA